MARSHAPVSGSVLAKWTPPTPGGFDVTPVLQPEQAPVVRRMFEMAAAGTPPSAIATWINSQGVDDRRVLDGRQTWSPKAVLRVLGNRVYIGRNLRAPEAFEAPVKSTRKDPFGDQPAGLVGGEPEKSESVRKGAARRRL